MIELNNIVGVLSFDIAYISYIFDIYIYLVTSANGLNLIAFK